MAPKILSCLRIETPLLREILAEFLGTFIIVVNDFIIIINLINSTSLWVRSLGFIKR